MKQLKLLVTGTGRSGTVYLAKVLTSLGYPCGHESIFDFEGLDAAIERLNGDREAKLSLVSCLKFNEGKIIPKYTDASSIVADSSYLSAPFLDCEVLKDTKIIHIVRNPVHVINSFVNYMDYFSKPYPSSPTGFVYEKFIYNHFPELTEEMTQYERCCLHWITWNQMIEEKCVNKEYLRWSIESDIKPLLDFIDKPFFNKDDIFNDKKANSFEVKDKPVFSLADLPSSDIKHKFISLGRKYGYPMSLDYLLI